jgi:hypothetical protein
MDRKRTHSRPKDGAAILHPPPNAYNEAIDCGGPAMGLVTKQRAGVNMVASWMSNALLVLGVAMLLLFGLLQFVGDSIDPLLPATAAFFIGCTAVLDRVSSRTLG